MQVIIKAEKKGFTLLELLVVVAIVAALVTIVIAALGKSKTHTKVVQSAVDLKEMVKVLELYKANNNGNYPCFDHNWNASREVAWSRPYYRWHSSPIGYQYHWEHQQAGFLYSISINGVSLSNAQALDKLMDDGNLATGIIRSGASGGRVEYGGMDQTVRLLSGTAHRNNQHCQ